MKLTTDGEMITELEIILRRISKKQQIRMYNWLGERIEIPFEKPTMTPFQREVIKMVKTMAKAMVPTMRPMLTPFNLKGKKKKNTDHFYGKDKS